MVALAAWTAFATPAHAQPDPAKVLSVALPIAETGFDPQAAGDAYSNYINRVLFDSLYRYDYLARPYALVPSVATALPEISADNKTWTIRLRPGIHFADDPAFKGKRRELTAADFVYSFKRILDPRMRSNSLSLIEGRIVGAEALVAKAKESGRFDYDAPLEGLQAVDRYTLRIRLNFPDTELLSNLTSTGMAAVAREVVEAYGDASGWVMDRPVGTGPYLLKEWRRGQKIVLEANPGYRDERYADPTDATDREVRKSFRGKRAPLIGRVEVNIIEEANPRLLAFEQGQLDYLAIPPDLASRVLDANRALQPAYAKQGLILGRGIMNAITGLQFNMEDPVVGGYANANVALRRAIAMAYNVDEEVRVVRQGEAARATQVIPPGATGHNPRFDGHARYDLASAKALLDKFGYTDRNGDGWRELPDGRALVIKCSSPPDSLARQMDEILQRGLTAIGVRVEFVKQKWPDQIKAARLGQLQMWFGGNISGTPEGFGFLGLFYGGHAGFSNLTRFKHAEFDRLYVEARGMPPGPERDKLMQRMTEIVSAYVPWAITANRYESVLVRPWVLGYKFNPLQPHPWAYLDIDVARRAAAPK
jgi:ABC-type transport system substrate-binding protein